MDLWVYIFEQSFKTVDISSNIFSYLFPLASVTPLGEYLIRLFEVSLDHWYVVAFPPNLISLYASFCVFLSLLFPAAVSNQLLIIFTVFLLISCVAALISRSSILVFIWIYNTQQFTQVQSSNFLNIWDIVVIF